ncbi:MAG: hypothetical protein ACRD1K_03205 [Acidimicrobiales bacterium]
MTGTVRIATEPMGMAGYGAGAWLTSLRADGFAGRIRHLVKNDGIVRPLGLTGGGSG